MSIERGIIKFFSAEKKFGFVTVLDYQGKPTKVELHLSYVNGFFVRMGDTEPEFKFRTGSIVDGKSVRNVDMPKKGVPIVFVRGKTATEDGGTIDKWAIAAQYDSIR